MTATATETTTTTVAEFVRQHELRAGFRDYNPELITLSYDPQAGPVTLTIDDLKALLQLANNSAHTEHSVPAGDSLAPETVRALTAAAARDAAGAAERVRHLLPWARALSARDSELLAGDLTDILHPGPGGCVDTADLELTLCSWRSTARAVADGLV